MLTQHERKSGQIIIGNIQSLQELKTNYFVWQLSDLVFSQVKQPDIDDVLHILDTET